MADYQIFTDATADLTAKMVEGLPSVKVIPVQVEIGGKEYTYGSSGTITAEEFYGLQRSGQFGSTSQINPAVYLEYLEPDLAEGRDVLYLCFTSGMSGTYQTSRLCMDDLREKYPERKIVCADTLCASVGEGLLVTEALKKQAEGFTIEELEDWVMEHRLQVCHWFSVDTFDYLPRGGRKADINFTTK